MDTKTVLVTGAAGFIGSVVAEEMLRLGHSVVVIDNLSKGHAYAVPAGAKFIEMDLRDRDSLLQLFQDTAFDAVLHLAAEAAIDTSITDPSIFFQVNTTGGINLLDAMVSGNCKDIVFSSTAAVYGEPKSIPIQENDPHEPVNSYGESKLLFERILPWYSIAYGVRHITLRYFNACGATDNCGEDREKETHLVPIAFEAISGIREKLSLFGTDWDTPDGTCIRDYVHVSDIAQAHVLALGALDKFSGNAYNLGNSNGFSNAEVLKSIEKVTGRTIPIVNADRRPGDPARLVASSDRARNELGWNPKYTHVDDMVRSAWAWHEKLVARRNA